MKKAILVLALVAFAATGAFGQIVFGLTGAQYYEEDSNGNLPTLSEAWVNFQEGTGVFWGGYGEIILDKLGLGMSFNQQTYKDPMYTDPAFDMWNYDVNFFLSYHIFGGRKAIKNLYGTGGCWWVGSNAGASESYNCYKIIAKDLNLPKIWEESDKKEPDSLVDQVFAAKKRLRDWGAAHPKKYGK